MQERFHPLILAPLRYASVGFAVRLRIFELLSKILSLGNTQINLVFRSLIRIFAAELLNYGSIHSYRARY